MRGKLLFILFIVCFNTTIYAQNSIELTSACSSGYGQGLYDPIGTNEGKPYYRFFGGLSGGDCSTLIGEINCDRDAIYYLKWETDTWYWIREPFQCMWAPEFDSCVPRSASPDGGPYPGDGPFTYLYSNTANTPEPPASGWTALPTVPPGYCEPSLATLSISSYFDNEFKVYPNPVNNEGFVTINLGTTSEKIKIGLYSVLGQLVEEKTFENTSIINLPMKHPQGTYFVKIQSGNQITVKRIAVQ